MDASIRSIISDHRVRTTERAFRLYHVRQRHREDRSHAFESKSWPTTHQSKSILLQDAAAFPTKDLVAMDRERQANETTPVCV